MLKYQMTTLFSVKLLWKSRKLIEAESITMFVLLSLNILISEEKIVPKKARVEIIAAKMVQFQFNLDSA